MISAPNIIDVLADNGISIWVEGNALRLHPAEKVDADAVAWLRDNKADVLALIRRRDGDEVKSTPAPITPTGPTITGAPCDRCGCTAFVEHPVHGGRSRRLDCGACGRTASFSKWAPEGGAGFCAGEVAGTKGKRRKHHQPVLTRGGSAWTSTDT